MGAGENGTIGAPANRAGNAYQPSNSTDSSAHAKFANALNQENGSTQVHGGGTKTPTVDNQMTGILNNPHLERKCQGGGPEKGGRGLAGTRKKRSCTNGSRIEKATILSRSNFITGFLTIRIKRAALQRQTRCSMR